MTLNIYRALRPHDGDRWYNEGDERVAAESDVAHLVGKTLELIGPAPAAAKADAPLPNKAITGLKNKTAPTKAPKAKAPARKR